jgi:transcriptional regulator with XRE-family HTH domain
VRALRKERGWTQSELAGRLGLSQSRLSEIERGDGSFTAEQFLLILRLFNVTTSRFTGERHDPQAQLQNALARMGAHHLHESRDVPPAGDRDDVARLLRDALALGDPRLTTALAPVLVAQVDGVSLRKLHLDLADVGLERRLAWLAENTALAIEHELASHPPRSWAQRGRRAAFVLDTFLGSLPKGPASSPVTPPSPDILDSTIRSKKTLDEVLAASSPISRKWGIVTTLAPADFSQALRAARVAHP